MSPYKVNCIFLPAAYHPAAPLSLFILSSPPCILIVSPCPLTTLIPSLFQSNILLFSSSYIISLLVVLLLSIPQLPTASALSSFPGPSSLFLPSHVFLVLTLLRLPPSPPTPCRRLKYEETIKLCLISIWTGGRRATAAPTTEPWKSTAELFLIPGMTFYRILLNETEQSSASPFRQSNYHQNKRA